MNRARVETNVTGYFTLPSSIAPEHFAAESAGLVQVAHAAEPSGYSVSDRVVC